MMNVMHWTAILQFFLSFLFLITAGSKFRALNAFRSSILAFGLVSYKYTRTASLVIPCLEAIAAVGMMFNPTKTLSVLTLTILLIAFTIAIGINLARGNRIDCNCFGTLSKKPISEWSIVRNLVLIGGLSIVWWDPYPQLVNLSSFLVPLFAAALLGLTFLVSTIIELATTIRRTARN